VITTLVRQRIARGTMPRTLDGLLEVRGTLEDAAEDLSQFTGTPFGECLDALREVYATRD
jgi:hypothetical protein